MFPTYTFTYLKVETIVGLSHCYNKIIQSVSTPRFRFTPGFAPGPQFRGFSWYLTSLTLPDAVRELGCLVKLAIVLRDRSLSKIPKVNSTHLPRFNLEQSSRRGVLGQRLHLHGVQINPGSEDIMHFAMWRGCFKRTCTCMWTWYFMTGIEKGRTVHWLALSGSAVDFTHAMSSSEGVRLWKRLAILEVVK